MMKSPLPKLALFCFGLLGCTGNTLPTVDDVLSVCGVKHDQGLPDVGTIPDSAVKDIATVLDTSPAVDLPPASGIFSPNNPWNTDISAYAVDPNSSVYIGSIGANTSIHPDFGQDQSYGIPYVVSSAAPLVPVTFTLYPNESDPGPYRIPLSAPIEQAADGHVIGVDLVGGKLYELYQGSVSGSGWKASNGAIFDLTSNALRPEHWTSADAAGLPIFPGLVRYDEVAAGAINHAIRFTVAKSQKGYIHPAVHAAGSCAINSACPPMGVRARLKASVDISAFPPQAKVIAQAMKKYGIILADNGSNMYITGAPSPMWNDTDLAKLKTLTTSSFEFVQTGAIMPQ